METVTGWPMELSLILEELLLEKVLFLIQALVQMIGDVSLLRQLLVQNMKNMYKGFEDSETYILFQIESVVLLLKYITGIHRHLPILLENTIS